MLIHLSIQNFVIVEQLEIDFKKGLSVVTGETGSGKSVLLDALNLTLGERAVAELVRPRYPFAEVAAIFDVSDLPLVQQWLLEHMLSAPNKSEQVDCIIRRVVTHEGKSKAFINGRAVPLAQLKDLGEKLVNFHGQHQHQALTVPDHQRFVLDAYANHSLLKEKVFQDYKEYKTLKDKQKELLLLQHQSEKLALLEYQIQELEELNLKPEEIALLESEHQSLSHAKEWIDLVQSILGAWQGEIQGDIQSDLHDKKNIDLISVLQGQIQSLKPLTQKQVSLKRAQELLTQSLIHLEEALLELQDFKDGLTLDPERLNLVEHRLSTIHSLARKHRKNAPELIEHLTSLKAERNKLLQGQEALDSLKESIHTLEKQYYHHAQQLSKSRQHFAETLSKAITDKIRTLEMPKGQFQISVLNPFNSESEFQTQCETQNLITPQGLDQVEFTVTTNPGQPLQSLRKVASGGELSRISLAIQALTAQKLTRPTLIFDEVDVGISGKTAEVVGKLLRALGKETQVLCVTHLPQVAALGQEHYQVIKHQTDEETLLEIKLLNKEEKVQEIARMLGGTKVTKEAIANATALLEIVD